MDVQKGTAHRLCGARMLNVVGAGVCENATQNSTQNSDQLVTPSQSPDKPGPLRLASRPNRRSRRRRVAPVRDLVLGGAAREVSFSEGPLGLRLAFKHDFDFGGIAGNNGGDGVVVVGFRRSNVGVSSPSIGQAEASGKVHLGDYVVGVGDVDVRGKSLAQVADLLQSQPRPLTIVFQSHTRADGHHERANASLGQSTESDERDMVFVRRDAGIRLSRGQRRAVEAPPTPVLIEAGPGSGKTTVLVFRVWHMVQALKVSPEHIAVLTFTNRAAREFQTRVEQLLTFQPMPDGLNQGVGDDENAFDSGRDVAQSLGYVGTFHGFCLRLLRRRGPDVGVPSRFVVASEPDLVDLVRHLLLKFSVVDARGAPSVTIRRVLDAVARGKKRAALLLAQHGGAAVPLANSQTGQLAQPTSSATPPPSNRASHLEQSIDTAVARELSQLWPSGHNRAISRSFATAFNHQLRFMGCLDFGDLLFYGLAVLQLEHAEDAKQETIDKGGGVSQNQEDTQANSCSRAVTARSLFRCVFVDEFQDVNEVQRAILRLFVRPHGNITAVGDFNQSIFNWTRLDRDDQPLTVQNRTRSPTAADPCTKTRWLHFLRDFGSRAVLPGSMHGTPHSSQQSTSSGTLVHLRRNFRCTSHIEACANAVLSAPLCQAPEKNNLNDTVHSQQPEEAAADDAESRRELPKAWKVMISSFQSGHEEASFAASIAGQALAAAQHSSDTKGSGRCRVALLFRNNYQAPLLEDALANLELPFYHIQSKSHASTAPEVRDFLDLLRVGVVNVSNYIAMRRVLRFALHMGKDVDNGTPKGLTARKQADPDAVLRWMLVLSGVENDNDDDVQMNVMRNSVDLVQVLQRSVRSRPVQSTGAVAPVSSIVNSRVSSGQCFLTEPVVLERLQNIATLLLELQERSTLPARELVPYLLHHPLFASMLLRYCDGEEYRLRACWRNLVQLEHAAKSGRYLRHMGSGSNAVVTTDLFDVFDYATTSDTDDTTSGRVMKLKSEGRGTPTSSLSDEDAEGLFQSSMWGNAWSSLEEVSQQPRVPVSRSASHISVEDFLSDITSLSGGEQGEELQAGRRGGAVALSTIHQAKGREWDVVVVVGLQEGTLPHHRRRSAQDLAEEQRLLYVAMTRARRQLVLSFVVKAVPRSLQTPRKVSTALPSVSTSSPTTVEFLSSNSNKRKLALPAGHCRWLSFLPKKRVHILEEVMISGPVPAARENASETHHCASHCEITPTSVSTAGRGFVAAGTITPSKTKTLSAPQPVKRRQSWLGHTDNGRSAANDDKLHPTGPETGSAGGGAIPHKKHRIDDTGTGAAHTPNTTRATSAAVGDRGFLHRSSLLLQRHRSV